MASSSSRSGGFIPNAGGSLSEYVEASKDVSVNKSARTLLEEAFHLKLQPLPHILHDKLSEPSVNSDFENQQDIQAKILENVMNNPKLSKQDKERIAKSILQGNYEFQTTESASRPNSTGNKATINRRTGHPVHTKDREYRQSATQENKLYLSRFNLPKPHFLEVVTQSANIPGISAKDVREQRMETLRKQHASLHTLPTELSASYEAPPTPLASTLSPQFQSYINPSTTDHQKFPFQSTLSRPLTSQKSAQLFYNENPHYKENCSRIISEERKKRIVRTREEIYLEREKIRKQKELDQLTAEKRMELKKKLNDFRQMLKDYLLEIKEPKSGEIMRCLDDSLIFYFMEQYNGHHLTPKAILALLSNTMGTSIIHTNSTVIQDLINPNDPGNGVLAGTTGVEYEPDEWQYITGGGMDMSEMTGPPMGNHHNIAGLPDGEVSPTRINSNMKGSVSNRLSYLALKKNYKDFGRRSPPKLQEYFLSDNPHYLQASRPNTTSATYFDAYDNGQPVGTYRPKRYQSNEPVEGYLPRPSDFYYNLTHPEAPLQPANPHSSSQGNLKPTLGSGFRTRSISPNQALSRSQVMMGMTSEQFPSASTSHPNRPHMSRTLPSTCPYPNDHGEKIPLVVLSSEHVHKVAKSMGISITSKEDEEVLRGHISTMMTGEENKQPHSPSQYDDSIFFGSKYQSSDGVFMNDDAGSVTSMNNAAANAAISIMHEQLMEEGLLPSLRPEKVLTDQQIEELGLHKKSLDEILSEIDKQKHPEDNLPSGGMKAGRGVGTRSSAMSQVSNMSDVLRENDNETAAGRTMNVSFKNMDGIMSIEGVDEEQLAAAATATEIKEQEEPHNQDDQASRASSKSLSTISTKSRGPSATNSVASQSATKEHIEELIRYEIQQEALLQHHQQQVQVQVQDEGSATSSQGPPTGTNNSHSFSFEDSILTGSATRSANAAKGGDGISLHSHTSSLTSGQKKDPQVIIIPVNGPSTAGNTNQTTYLPSSFDTASRPTSSNPYAINTSLTAPFHLQPLTPINPASSTNPMHFYGSNLPTSDQEKQRLQTLATTEQERAIKRLLLPAARDPNEKFKEFLEEFPELKLSPTAAARERNRKEREMKATGATTNTTAAMMASSSSKSREGTTTTGSGTGMIPSPSTGMIITDEVVEEGEVKPDRSAAFPLNRTVGNDKSLRQLSRSISLPEPKIQKGPLAIKSHTVYEERNGSSNLPVNPYKSFEEETKVMNTGVPSGAGLLLWRPRDKATARGRYRVGLANHSREKLMEEKKLPFVSMT